MPSRRCFFCAKVALKSELFRFTLKDGAVSFDMKKTLPGRGAYLCKDKECIAGACKRGFSRAFRVGVSPVDLRQLLDELGLS